MSTDATHRDADTKVIELYPPPDRQLRQAEAPATAPAPAVPAAGTRRPVIPVPLQRANIRATTHYAAGLSAHRAAYHGVRSPFYLLRYIWHAIRGAGPGGPQDRAVVACPAPAWTW